MRIWILTQFYTPEVGAAAVRLSRLATSLAADGNQVTVLTSVPNYPAGVIPPEYWGKLLAKETKDGVEVRRVWVYTSPNKRNLTRIVNQISFMAMSALAGTFMHRPDILLVESHPLFICLAGGWLKRMKHTPIVLNVSDLWPESAIATGALRAESHIVKIAERVERWAYNDAAHIVGMTEGVVEGINKVHQRPERVSYIPNAVDLECFRPGLIAERASMRKQMGVGERFAIVHIGNMSLTYDFDLILDAAACLPNLAFVFVGAGSQLEYIRQRVSNENLANVILMGTLPHMAMPAVWAAADVCIIAMRDSSLAGGTRPAKMYEAMATGTPIVAAIRGEGEELLRLSGAGIPTPVGDQDAMVEALRLFAENAQARQLASEKGRAYAEAHLSPKRVKLSFTEIFKQIMSHS